MTSPLASSKRPATHPIARAALFVAPLLALLACTINAPISAPINVGPANPDEVRSCRETCAKQGAANCFDDHGLVSCNAACDASSSAGATTFVQCVQASTCNEKCDADLKASAVTDGGVVPEAGPTPYDAGDAGKDSSTPPVSNGLQECNAACDSPLAKSCFEVAAMRQRCLDGCAAASSAARASFVSCTFTLKDCSGFYNTTCFGGIGGG